MLRFTVWSRCGTPAQRLWDTRSEDRGLQISRFQNQGTPFWDQKGTPKNEIPRFQNRGTPFLVQKWSGKCPKTGTRESPKIQRILIGIREFGVHFGPQNVPKSEPKLSQKLVQNWDILGNFWRFWLTLHPIAEKLSQIPRFQEATL